MNDLKRRGGGDPLDRYRVIVLEALVFGQRTGKKQCFKNNHTIHIGANNLINMAIWVAL